MAQYINFEAEAEFSDGNSGKEDDEFSFISESDSFIDDQEVEGDIDLYRQYQFTNVERDIDEDLAEAREEALAEIDRLDEVSNLSDSEGNYEPLIDDDFPIRCRYWKIWGNFNSKGWRNTSKTWKSIL